MEAETTFYPDEGVQNSRDAVQKLKSKMTLDFGGSSGTSSKQSKLGGGLGGVGGLLGSPDLQMLKLASPELERMIIQQNGMVTTTPTPTQFLCPKFVTEEQEAYARGFVDALNELHKQQPGDPDSGVPGAALPPPPPPPHLSLPGPAPVAVTSSIVAAPHTTTTTSCGGASSAADLPFTFTSTTTAFPGSAASSNNNTGFPTSISASLPSVSELTGPLLPGSLRLPLLKQEEPQTVPCLGRTPPLSPIMPINMETQEVIKIERKRARNRVAARKCRTRKLERISRLEDRVNELKDQNTDLSGTANTLRDQVCRLKTQIMEHVNSGCQVMLSQNLL